MCASTHTLKHTGFLALQPGLNDGKEAADAAAPSGPKQVRLVAQAKQMGAVIGMKGATIKCVCCVRLCVFMCVCGFVYAFSFVSKSFPVLLIAL